MASEAQLKANAKYVKEHTKTFSLRFYPKDMDLYEHIQRQPKKAEYLKDLIRRDMEDQG